MIKLVRYYNKTNPNSNLTNHFHISRQDLTFSKMKTFKFLVFGFWALAVIQNAQGQDLNEGFKNYFYHIMQSFPNWVEQKGVDPTPVLVMEHNISVSNTLLDLSGTLNNLSIYGLSNPNFRLDSRLDFMSGTINFYYYGPAEIEGICNISGTVLSTHPISANSTWRFNSSDFTINFQNNFDIVDGFIKLNEDLDYWSYSSAEFGFSASTTHGGFEGLITPDVAPYEQQIKAELVNRMPIYVFGIDGSRLRLFYPYFYEFLQERFDETPISEIIIWPPTTWPPTTWPPASEPSTPRPPTTQLVYTTIQTITYPPTTGPSTLRPCLNREIQNTGLSNFLKKILYTYPAYLISNGLDPSTPIFTPSSFVINTTLLELDCTFRNSVGAGMSNLPVSWNSVISDLIIPRLGFNVTFTNPSIYGQYSANGSMISTYPLEGEGNWEINYGFLNLEYEVNGFEIENGYININRNTNSSLRLFGNGVASFPDLVTPDSADGLGAVVLDILAFDVPELMTAAGVHPVAKSYLDYVHFRLSNTPLTDIIGTEPCGP